MTVSEIIAVHDLVKDYQGLRPLRVKELVVRARERVALSGFDATSAEVFINVLNGAILPDSGEVRILGRPTSDIADETEWFASLDRFGIVTARAVLLDALTVRQNLALPFTADVDHLDATVRGTTDALAAEAGLDAGRLDERMEGMSVESRMRTHLARALATDPQLLLLEHPTASLPPGAGAPFGEAVRRVADARQLTLVAITEDTAFADVVADAHFRLQGGSGALVNARGWRRWI